MHLPIPTVPTNAPLRVTIARVGVSTPAHRRAARMTLDTARQAHRFWQKIVSAAPDFEPDKEHLVAILLDTKLKPLGYHIVSIGTLDACITHPRDVFRPAVVMGAYGLIVLHNHPSGDPAPSKADHRLTRQLHDASLLLQIVLFDHVIVSGPGRRRYYSFRDGGFL